MNQRQSGWDGAELRSTFSGIDPDRPAIIMGVTGERVTYGELDRRSRRAARLMTDELGLRRGDRYAVLMENNRFYHEVVWAGLRSGLQVTAVNSHLTAAEAAYIINDSGARVLFTSGSVGEMARDLVSMTPGVEHRFVAGGQLPGHADYEAATAGISDNPLLEQRGMVMLYSSGTTGHPKGIQFPLPPPDGPLGEFEIAEMGRLRYGFGPAMVFLSPAPLYHSAPLRMSLAVHTVGGTVLVMERFDPELALALMERHGVTHSQWVPTMFIRMLKLPETTRNHFDLSRHRLAMHGAAPCPVAIKEAMIDWWGPIIEEYYSGTENVGGTAITSEEWLAHKGSVGRPALGAKIHICSEDGTELEPGGTGTVYFEQTDVTFAYHDRAPESNEVSHPDHATWRTLGDVGHVDTDGYLYLTDRRAFMIVSGGVNVYPQEIEDVLVTNPKVLDAAVFGVPNEEMGEEIKAVVQLVSWSEGTSQLRGELEEWCSARLAGYKRPRSIDFIEQLPRLENGKLYKSRLRDAHWQGRGTKVI